MKLVHAEPVRVQQAQKDIQATAEVASMKAIKRSVRLKADQADIDLEDTGAHVVTAKQVANAKLRRATSSMLGAIILFAFVSTTNSRFTSMRTIKVTAVGCNNVNVKRSDTINIKPQATNRVPPIDACANVNVFVTCRQ